MPDVRRPHRQIRDSEVVVGATWPGGETSQAFMQAHGVELVIVELEACQPLLAGR